MRHRALSIVFRATVAATIAIAVVSCSRPNRWSLSGTASGAVFVGDRPGGEIVKVSIRSTRQGWAFLTLSPDSPDGGAVAIDPPIAVRIDPSSLAVAPFEMRETTTKTQFMRTSNESCNPCSLDIDISMTRAGDGGIAPVAVRWSLFSSISGEEEVAPEGERITVIPR